MKNWKSLRVASLEFFFPWYKCTLFNGIFFRGVWFENFLNLKNFLLCLGLLEGVRRRYDHRRGVKFKDAFAFWFAAVTSEQLLTASALHMHKVSFSQRGTLAFAACLSNLTCKGLGHLSLSAERELENICRHLSITGACVMELEFREDYSHR